jgi:uncharacterized protein (DUF305 family)
MRGLGLVAIVVAIGACRTTPRNEAPATAPTPAQPQARGGSAATPRRYAAADVRFMQGMIAHHAQALAMTALVPARTTRGDLRLLAERIEVSQRDEIALMRQWLEQRGEKVPSIAAGHEHHAAGQQALPHGMLSEAEMAQLARASGGEFDRLFLELMIRHHEGALRMVAELFAAPGAAQETETYRLATDVDADQRAEIARIRALLQQL